MCLWCLHVLSLCHRRNRRRAVHDRLQEIDRVCPGHGGRCRSFGVAHDHISIISGFRVNGTNMHTPVYVTTVHCMVYVVVYGESITIQCIQISKFGGLWTPMFFRRLGAPGVPPNL